MKIVILGGTHGNEFVGVEVIKNLEKNPVKDSKHEYKTIFSNPKSHEIKKRYVDYDLNRSFGPNTQTHGYEKQRAAELKEEIEGKFDFLIDLHTTTSNMGLTLIINYEDQQTLNAAAFLKTKFPELVLIKGADEGATSSFVGSLVHSGLTIEVGPVANSVIDAQLVFTCQKIVSDLLSWDFKDNYIDPKMEIYQTGPSLYYPDGNWYIHPDFQDKDFVELKKGDAFLISPNGQERPYDGESAIYPFFINEAAYLESNIICSSSRKTTLAEYLK